MRVEQLVQRVVPMVPLKEACCLAIPLVPVFPVRILLGSSTSKRLTLGGLVERHAPACTGRLPGLVPCVAATATASPQIS